MATGFQRSCDYVSGGDPGAVTVRVATLTDAESQQVLQAQRPRRLALPRHHAIHRPRLRRPTADARSRPQDRPGSRGTSSAPDVRSRHRLVTRHSAAWPQRVRTSLLAETDFCPGDLYRTIGEFRRPPDPAGV